MKLVVIGIVFMILVGATIGTLGFMGVVRIPGITPKKVKKQAKAAPPALTVAATVEKSKPSETEPNVTAKQPSQPVARVKPTVPADPEAEKKLVRLASVYEQVSAEEAGMIFAKLPDPLVEKLMRKMDERQVGKILMALGPERAAKLTLSLSK